MNRLGLEFLTLLGMPPVEHVKLAAELGCVSISLSLTAMPLAQFGHGDFAPYPEWSLIGNKALQRELKAALKDTGVHIGLAEGFRVRPDADLRDRADELDLVAELGARRVNAVSMERDLGRTYDLLGALCEMVTARGMQFIVEFAPPNAINTLAMALEAANHVGLDRCQIMFDSMHFFRSGAKIEDIAKLPAGILGYAQLCDAKLVGGGEPYMQEALFARLTPGEGELPLKDWIAALPADLEIGVEAPNIADLKAKGPHAHAAHVIAGARSVGA